ncbi:hypothetical protein ABK040_013016 [Willaertia magna]
MLARQPTCIIVFCALLLTFVVYSAYALDSIDHRSLFSVGTYFSGETGIDLTNTPVHPYPLDDLPFRIKEVFVGSYHNAFLTTEGELYSFGIDTIGKFGSGSIQGYPTTIKSVKFNVDEVIVKVAVGYCHMLVLTEVGKVYGAGCTKGFLNKGGIPSSLSNPIMVFDSSKNIVDIQSGYEFSTLLTGNGEIYVVGSNNFGQYGNASLSLSGDPVLVNFGVLNGKEIIRVRTGQYCTVVETSTKEFILFGTLYSNGYEFSKSEPIIIDVISGNNWKSFSDYKVTQDKIILFAEGNIHDVRLKSAASFFLSVYYVSTNSDIKLLEENKVLTGDNRLYTTSSPGYFVEMSLKNIKEGTRIEKIFMGSKYGNSVAFYMGIDGTVYFSVTYAYDISYGTTGSSFGLYPFNVTSFYNAFNPSLLKMVKPSKGGPYTIFMDEENILFSTGIDNSGSLGYGYGASVKTPQKIGSSLLKDKVIVDVSVGLSHTLILTSDGLVYAFGDNTYNQFCGGLNSAYQSLQQLPLTNVTAISAGYQYSLFVINSGSVGKRVYACGGSLYGQTGLGVSTKVVGFVDFFDGMNVSSVVASSYFFSFSFFVTNNGSVYGVGYNQYYILGVGTTYGSATISSPVRVLLSEAVIKVDAMSMVALFLTTKGEVYVSGNAYPAAFNTPTKVAVGKTIIDISVGPDFAFLLTSDGEVYGIKYVSDNNYAGQIGVGLNPATATAIKLPFEYKVKTVEAGYRHSFFIMEPSFDNCNGNGLCVGANTCSCFSGNQCQYPICNSIPSTQISTVCNGHGSCIAPNVCNCDSTLYSGQYCEYPICFGVASNQNNVCSGNGICSAPNTCNCFQPTLEENCVIISPNPSLKLETTTNQFNALCTSAVNIILNASQTTYSPKHQAFILYNWLAQRTFGVVAIDVTSSLFGSPGSTLSNSITTNNLLNLGLGDYKFGVNVKDSYNGLNRTTYYLTPVSVIASFDLSININGKLVNDINNVLRTSETNILVNAFHNNCGNVNNNLLQYNIKLIDTIAGMLIFMTTSNNLIIPPKTFTNVDMYYTVEIEATFKEMISVKKVIQLYIYPQTASLQIIGGNKSASTSNSITLNSLLKDPDELSFTPQYSWECKIEDSSNSKCPIDLSNSNTPTLTIPSNTFNDAMRVVFTLNCTIGNVKYVTSSAFLQYERLQLPTISVNSYDNYVSKHKDILFRVNVIPSDKESELLFKWTFINQPLIDLQKISIAGIDKQDIGIKASTNDFNNLLVEGNEYILQLNVTQRNNRLNQQVFAFTTINFKVNQAPIVGQLTINPLQGIATQTEFTFNVSSFIDIDQPNNPLTYAYGYFKYDSILKQKEKIILIDYTQNTLVKVKLPFISSNTEVFVIAKDSLGAESLLSTTITLTDPTSTLSNNQITKLVENQLNTTKSVNDILLISSLLNTNNEQQVDNICGTNNNCNGNGICNLNEKRCDCYSSYSGKYCQLTISEKIGRENVRDQLLTSVISFEDNSTSTKTKLQTVESIISNTDEINTNVAKKALSFTSTVFSNSKDIQLVDQVIKVVSNVIEAITSVSNTNTNDNNSTTKEELNENIRNTLMSVANQQVNNMIQGQSKSITLSNIKQTIIKETLNAIINNNNNQVKLTSALNNILNPNDVIGFETTLIGNLFSSEKNVSSSIFRMNIFSNNEQQSIANLTESILFNITVNNNLISLENNNLTLVCKYYNETTKELSSDGVFVNRIININNNETIIECGTSHLTDFVIVKTSTTKKNIIPVVSSGNSGNNPPREISGKKTVVNQSSTIINYHWLFTMLLTVLMIIKL